MGTTTAGLRYPASSAAPDVAGDIYALATDVDSQLRVGGAEYCADATTRNAIPTARCYIGKLAFQADNGMTYRWNGNAWKPWNSDWQSFTPNQTGATSAGGGTLQALWRLSAGEVLIDYTATIANTANARVEVGGLPYPRGNGGRAMPKGRAILIASNGGRYPLNIDFNAEDTNSNTLIVRTTASPEADSNGQSVPANWSGGTFKMSFSYTPTL